MRIATKDDRVLVGNIIAESFKDNPNILFMIRPSKNKEESIKSIANHAFDFALKRNGVYISSDTEGVIIFYKQPSKRDIWDFFSLLKLVFFVLDLKKISTILKRDAHLKALQPENLDYLYVWLLAVVGKGRNNGTAFEIKNFIFEHSTTAHLPIFAETTVLKNKVIYERYGFETYQVWCDEKNGLTTWFMKKN